MSDDAVDDVSRRRGRTGRAGGASGGTKAATPKKRSAAAKPPLPEKLRLRYTLAELPSAQHRAGLAGLVVALRRLERDEPRGVAAVVELDEAGATFEFDELG